MEIISSPFLTVDEIADLARCSPEWVKREIKRGALGCFHIAGRVRIAPEQLLDWLALMEKRPRIGMRGFTVLERDGTWELRADGAWIWRSKDRQLQNIST